jgi:predicted nucleic acid-binding protein
MVVIDTDVLIQILRGDKEIEKIFRDVITGTEGYIFITPVQIAEIYAGIRPREKAKVENFIDALNVIGIDKNISKLAGKFMNEYGKSHNVTMADALIAASTKKHVFKLWTLNKKHYPMFEDGDFYIIKRIE